MLRKLFLVPAVLSLVVLGFAVDVAQAQSRRAMRREVRQERRDMRRGVVYTDSVMTSNVVIDAPGAAFTYTGPGYSTRSYSYYYSPADPAVTVATPASIRMILPNPTAKVWFDGTLMTQTGNERLFATPALAAGTHSYTIRAVWMDGNREMAHERTIHVMPGRTTVVDFTRR